MYEKAIVAMAKQSVTLEVLSYHASASIEDAVRLRVRIVIIWLITMAMAVWIDYLIKLLLFHLQNLKIPSVVYFQLHDFNFDDIYMDDDDTLRVIAINLSPVKYNLLIACCVFLSSYLSRFPYFHFFVSVSVFCFFFCVHSNDRRACECSWNWTLLNGFILIMKCCAGGCWAWKRIIEMLLITIGGMRSTLHRWCFPLLP